MSSLYENTLEEIINVGSKLNVRLYQDIEFMGPIGWALLKSYNTRNSISIGENCFTFAVARYLKFVGAIEGTDSSSNPKNVIKMKCIGNGNDCDEIANETATVAEIYVRSRQDELYPNLKYYISELTGNIPHHSEDRTSAFICGQYYKQRGVLQIAIVDSGIGILNSLRHTEIVRNHEEALLCAIKPGTTGNPGTGYYGVGNRNMGFGLPVCLKTIKSNSGDFFLGTGDKLLTFNGEGVDIDENYTEQIINLPFNWQGTFIVFNLYTGKEQYIDYGSIYDSISDSSEDIALAIF